jgi:hypothetical protein
MDAVRYFTKCISYFGIGLLLALLINEMSGIAIKKLGPNWLWSLAIRLLMTVSVLFAIEKWISPRFAADWQDSTAGILFGFGMFGGQLFDVQTVENDLKKVMASHVVY